MAEYADHFREGSNVPASFYPIMVLGAPVVVAGTYYRSFFRDGPIEKIDKVQL